MGDSAVVLTGITKSFDGVEVLRGIDLSLAPGSVTALLGPSGCGKTTALRIVAGLELPDSGTVEINGTIASGPAVNVPTEQRRVGMIFQNGALFPHLSVAHNVGYGLPRSERRSGVRIAEMLDLVGLTGFDDRAPDSLSGGQAQRVALARALAPAPSVVLMDEPFSNLDAVLRTRLRREVGDVVRVAGVTVVLVTHDRDEAFALADRVAVMRDGVIVQEATPRELYRSPVDDGVAAFVGDIGGTVGSGRAALRPEDLEVVAPEGRDSRSGVVVREEFGGADVLTTVAFDDGSEVLVRSRAAGVEPREPGAPVGVRLRR